MNVLSKILVHVVKFLHPTPALQLLTVKKMSAVYSILDTLKWQRLHLQVVLLNYASSYTISFSDQTEVAEITEVL